MGLSGESALGPPSPTPVHWLSISWQPPLSHLNSIPPPPSLYLVHAPYFNIMITSMNNGLQSEFKYLLPPPPLESIRVPIISGKGCIFSVVSGKPGRGLFFVIAHGNHCPRLGQYPFPEIGGFSWWGTSIDTPWFWGRVARGRGGGVASLINCPF